MVAPLAMSSSPEGLNDAPVTGRRVPPTVPAVLATRARVQPDRTAFNVGGSRSATYLEWDQRSNAMAHGLLERGVRPGDRVATLFDEHHWIEYAVAYVAIQKAGAVAVPIPARVAPSDIGWMLDHCGARGVVHDGRSQGVSDTPVWTANDLESDVTVPPDVVLKAEDLAQILYTSGTTGRPKGVAASHGNLTFEAGIRRRGRAMAHSEYFAHAFPIGTNAGQTMLLNSLHAHPAALILPRFTPDRFARLVAEHAAGTVFVVPAMAMELLNARVRDRHDLSGVLLLGSTAAPLPPSVGTALAQAFPNAMIVNYYTSTEAAPAGTTMVFDPERSGSLGRASGGNSIMIADSGGQPLPAGRAGEVWLRSGATARAYYKDRQATDEVFRHGWIRTGDLGYLDPDGYLYLVDRESDVIKSGAFKVSTIHVEAAVHRHPDVTDAACFGIPHPVLGKAVAAAVVTRTPMSAADLRRFLADQLAPHEVPARVIFLDALPRNDAGKVMKRELRQRAEGV
ncbi:class I adenylate-forming enzyme family protein [Rhizohabitans arisaemae]|uniref:class I adenylate-forming enzyme family protein n=1 Tax=Rhizohabitans arisaemae TaxID=2720610 RepID=UPI0024B0C39A|nr:class I adenylate-forming enzyme family protein [Rhizohabitans arisaemae]